MSDALICMEAVQKVFLTDEVETHALSDISLSIGKGEYVSIAGPSGCGKSTLLSLMGLLDTPTSGVYNLAGHSVASLNSRERANIRNREIGFVFQSFNLISDMTVQENVELPLTYQRGLGKRAIQQRAVEALQKVAMDHRVKHYPSQLSGGQQQRVAIARALVGQPSLILADEPTGNLDSKNAAEVMALLDLLHQGGATICMVTHDPQLAKRAHRSIVMADGKVMDNVVQTPSLHEVLAPTA